MYVSAITSENNFTQSYCENNSSALLIVETKCTSNNQLTKSDIADNDVDSIFVPCVVQTDNQSAFVSKLDMCAIQNVFKDSGIGVSISPVSDTTQFVKTNKNFPFVLLLK